MEVSTKVQGGHKMRGAVRAAVIFIAAAAMLALVGPTGTAAQGQLTAGDIVTKNFQAAGGEEPLDRVKNVSFSAGPARYTASADGRMVVRYVLEDPEAYEVLIVSGTAVRRNSLNRISELSGVERGKWVCLARLASGLFTLKNFGTDLTCEGLKIFGPERHYVLSTQVEGLRALFSVDESDFLVKRMVLSGVDAAGESWEESTEFGSAETVEGFRLPTALYVSQVGVSGTYSPGPRPLGDFRIDSELPAGFFDDLKVNCGRAEAAPGRLEGNVLLGLFEEEDLFVRVFTNWTEEDIRAAGFKNGDILIMASGGTEFETKLYVLENQVDDPTVYSPGNSLFTHTPTRFPGFYAQFNTLSPREKFDDLRARIKPLAPVQARKKEQGRSS
jgi:hypothetical protein